MLYFSIPKWIISTFCCNRFQNVVIQETEEIARMEHADIKNIAGNDQATLMVYQNYANIKQSFKIYVYMVATDAPQLMASSGDR